MEFIKSADTSEGVEAMAEAVALGLKKGSVVWLLCGGSNIPLAKEAMDILRTRASGEEIKNLTIGLTDERYGRVAHKDSNWQQLLEVGFNFDGVKTMPILFGKSLEETVKQYDRCLSEAFGETDIVIAQFGIGTDGHIAGMLPHTGGLSSSDLVFGYEAPPYVRITITPPAFKKIDEAFAFVFGESKREVVTRLWQKDLRIDEMPCQILKRIPESRLYSDQL